ncbi:MAG: cation transporter [Deltaproteobacteria bacterium]|nr:MAG: cation transporter [Deltaproteobacteria bacterium]
MDAGETQRPGRAAPSGPKAAPTGPPSGGTGAAGVSLAVAVLLLGAKLLAWRWTGSTAVLSDALESIVNVVAAGFALWSLRLANEPADLDHPYGHGKIEFVSAAFEGGLVFLAGLVIAQEAVQALIRGSELERLGEGIAITGAAAVVNLLLGAWLVRVGRKSGSLALVADGKHVLSDVWTSAMTVLALVLVKWSGQAWLDPAVALVAAANLLRIGGKVVLEAVHGIMDVADPEDLERVTQALSTIESPRFVGWSKLRSRHQGRFHHVDLTIYVPGEISVEEAHEVADEVERVVREALGEAQVICHIEPARLMNEARSGL